MKRLAFFLLAVATLDAILSDLQPLPPMPKPRLQSPRGALHHFMPAALAPPPARRLVWEHVNETTNVVEFDVEEAPTPLGAWTRLGTTRVKEFPITTELEQRYWRVGSHWVEP